MNIHKAPNPAMVKATLYLGASIDGHFEVTEDRFAEYLTHVTPHFPGFTVSVCEGYWKGQPEVVRVMTILATDTNGLREQVRMFAEQYKTMFAQEAVAYDFAACEFTLDCWPYGPVKAYHKPGKGF